MASIDRYRPPMRDGYPPPPSSATLSGPARSSRSPTRRPKDVPPPVPTPPPNSTHTSPPPPRSNPAHSPNGQQQPPPPPRADPWLFSSEEVVSSPSILDGMSLKEQRLRRAKGVNFIYQVGCHLALPQLTQWVAGVFFHRFYMRYSMMEEKGGLHHYNIAATAVFLACKAEENCRKTKNVIIAVSKVAQKNPNLLIDEQSKEYWRWRDSILTYEELMLEYLTFDVSVTNPYNLFFEILGQLGLRDDKELRQAAWAFCNDACLTHMPLVMSPRDIALSAISFACLYTGHKIDDIKGEPWWKAIGASEDKCLEAITIMSDFYHENPLQKRNPSLASPAFHLDTTRRRGEAVPSHAGSSVGTPVDAAASSHDRATQSPPRSVPRSIPSGNDAPLQEDNDDNDNDQDNQADAPLSSPAKRKGSVDDESEDERASKKARMSEDEGEVMDE